MFIQLHITLLRNQTAFRSFQHALFKSFISFLISSFCPHFGKEVAQKYHWEGMQGEEIKIDM